MKCFVLAAGYATRLYPLTENFPKPLLKVGGKTILDWLTDDIAELDVVSEFVVISNHKFAHHFENWAKNKKYRVTVVDDGTDTNETRLGAVRDIQFAMDALQVNEDIMVIAGDNVLDFSLKGFLEYAKEKGTSCVMCHEENRLEKQQKTAIITKDANGLITSYEEKPKEPKGNLAVPPFYFYCAEDAKRIPEALADGCNADAPGSFAAWLCKQTEVHAYEMPGKRYDIGDIKSYEEVQKVFAKTVFVTGAAGFIGSNLVLRLLKKEDPVNVIGMDNMNDYYDVSLKEYRLQQIEELVKESKGTFTFIKASIADKTAIEAVFEKYHPDIVVNLAAQAGVRYSITNPDVYIESNLIGFYNILEACRHSYDNGAKGVEHLVYASSSSVYGSNKKIPYSTEDKVDNPVSLYAATKKSNELLAHAYSKLYGIPSTGLRFFTVYGPAGRPDMAYFGFTNKLRKGETIQIFNYGNCKRDFTYVDDIVEGVLRVMEKAPEKVIGEDGLFLPPYAVYNIGNNQPENLLDFVQILSEELVRAGVLPEDYDFEAHKELVPMQAGDVPVTYADTTALEENFGFKPSTSLREGLRRFAEWYKEFYM